MKWDASCVGSLECRNVLHCVAGVDSVLQCVAVCCSVLQCVAVCCSVLQCVTVTMSVVKDGDGMVRL